VLLLVLAYLVIRAMNCSVAAIWRLDLRALPVPISPPVARSRLFTGSGSSRPVPAFLARSTLGVLRWMCRWLASVAAIPDRP
jgi:hypothetical protein